MAITRRQPGTSRAAPVMVVTALVLVGLGPTSLSAQATDPPRGEVTGTVVAVESGVPVGGATVTLEPAAADEAATLPDGARLAAGPAAASASDASDAPTRVTTDHDGVYRFTDVRPGRYRLSVSRIGFRSSTLWIDVPASWSIRRSLELEVEPISLRPIDVSVDRPASGGWATGGWASTVHPARSAFGGGVERTTLDARVLEPDDMVDGGTLGEPDILRALQRLPGASGKGDFSAALWTRGAPWGLTQILLDGLPLYDPLHLGGTATGVSADGLGAVFFMPGVRPAALAEGAAGTVSLVTRRATAGFDGHVAASPVSVRARVEDRFVDERIGVSVSGRRSWWDLVDIPSLMSADASEGAVDYHFADVSGRVDVRLDEHTLLEAGGLWEEDRIDGDIHDLVSASNGRWGNRQAWIALGRSLGSANVRLFAGDSRYSAETAPHAWASFRAPNGIPSLTELEINLARRLVRLESHGRAVDGMVRWEVGAERVAESLFQQGIESHDRKAPGNDESTEAVWGRAWGQATVEWSPLRLMVGGAVDDLVNGDIPSLGLLPSAALRWQATDRVALEVATGRSRQFAYPVARTGGSFGPGLSVGHVWYLAGEDRPPITSRIHSVGLEARLGHDVVLLASAWSRRMDDLWLSSVSRIDNGERVFSDIDRPGIFGVERAQGLEMTLRRAAGRLTGEAGYTYGRSVVRGDPEKSAWLSPSDRKHSVDVTTALQVMPGVRVGAAFRSETGWPVLHGPWVCESDDGGMREGAVWTNPDCTLPEDDDQTFSISRAPRYQALDLNLDWSHRGEHVGLEVRASVHNVLGRDNAAAHRASTCEGAELTSVVCEVMVGPPRFAPGLTSPTPALSVRMLF